MLPLRPRPSWRAAVGAFTGRPVTRWVEVIAISLLLGVTCGCAIRVGQHTERQSAQIAPADTPGPLKVVTDEAEPPPTDPNAILTCDCIERR